MGHRRVQPSGKMRAMKTRPCSYLSRRSTWGCRLCWGAGGLRPQTAVIVPAGVGGPALLCQPQTRCWGPPAPGSEAQTLGLPWPAPRPPADGAPVLPRARHPHRSSGGVCQSPLCPQLPRRKGTEGWTWLWPHPAGPAPRLAPQSGQLAVPGRTEHLPGEPRAGRHPAPGVSTRHLPRTPLGSCQAQALIAGVGASGDGRGVGRGVGEAWAGPGLGPGRGLGGQVPSLLRHTCQTPPRPPPGRTWEVGLLTGR